MTATKQDPARAALATRMAAVQMVSGPVVESNLAEAATLLARAADGGARLAALPEFFPIMGLHETDKVKVRERLGSGRIQDFLAETALRLGIWIVGGSVPLEAGSPGKVLNTCLVYDAAGRLAGRYDKIHLFGFDNGRER